MGHRNLRRAVGLNDGTILANEEQIKAMQELADKAIKSGSAGIGFGINYSPGASYEEVFALFEVATANNVPRSRSAMPSDHYFYSIISWL